MSKLTIILIFVLFINGFVASMHHEACSEKHQRLENIDEVINNNSSTLEILVWLLFFLLSMF